MQVLRTLWDKFETILASGSTADQRRPAIKKGNESSVKGLHIVGDLAGAPVIKLAMAQGVEVIDYLSTLPEMKNNTPQEGLLDVAIIGAGASGLNAALAAKEKGMSYVLLEKGKIANTIEDFPEGKWVYAEPDKTPAKGKLWLDGARKEDLVERWGQIVRENDLDVRTEEPLTELERQKDGTFVLQTSKGEYRARKVVLATGQRGNPRKLGVPGEEQERVYHRLYSPRKYRDQDILVVGGGNSAIEAALTLSEQNRVILSYRSGEFARVFKDNREKLDAAIAAKKIEVVFHSNVKEFGQGEATLTIDSGGHQEERVIPADTSFVLVGAELPVKFLKKIGIELENEWKGVPWRAALLTFTTFLGLWFFGGQASLFGADLSSIPSAIGAVLTLASVAGLIITGIQGDRFSWLGFSFWICYSVYGIKVGRGDEFWPYKDWAYDALIVFDRPWSFWYTVVYTLLMTYFGIAAIKRWGFDRKDKLQVWRYISLISFQWIFFFLVPEFLFQYALQFEVFGEALSNDPQFADQTWRAYGLIYAWPLFFYTWFWDPHMVWVLWGVFLTFVVVPVFVLFHGKRYCSWICGCGGLAETFADRWRHLAPKGKESIKWEWMSVPILVFAFVVTLFMLTKDVIGLFRDPADYGLEIYKVLVDVWLVGILPVTLYPFLGGKVWCRYWCPLAKMMGLMSKWYSKVGVSKFAIESNDKCIGCNECSRNCQVGIPVMQYALKQETLDNETSGCIGCGICVSVCPMDTLYYGPVSKPTPIEMPDGSKVTEPSS